MTKLPCLPEYCHTERYEINSEHTKGNNIKYQLCEADAHIVRPSRNTFSNNGGYEV